MRVRIGIIAVMLVAFVACEEASVTNQPDEGADATPAQTQTAKKAGVGDAITLQGSDDNLKMRVTVVSVADPATPKDANLFGPEAGNRLVGIQLRMENVGSMAYSDSPGNGAKLIDTQGQQYDEEIATEITQGPLLGSSVTVAPGSDASGWMVFELGQTEQLRTFQMALDSGFAGQHGEWSLGED